MKLPVLKRFDWLSDTITNEHSQKIHLQWGLKGTNSSRVCGLQVQFIHNNIFLQCEVLYLKLDVKPTPFKTVIPN